MRVTSALNPGGDDAPGQGDFDDFARGDLVGATDHRAVGSADDRKTPLHHVLGRQRASMALKCAQVVLARCKARHHWPAPIAGFEPLAAAFSSMARVLATQPVACMAKPAPGSFEARCQRPAEKIPDPAKHELPPVCGLSAGHLTTDDTGTQPRRAPGVKLT